MQKARSGPEKSHLVDRQFQSVRSTVLFRRYSEFVAPKDGSWQERLYGSASLMTPKMSETSKFSKEELEYVRGIASGIAENNSRFKLHELSIDGTTQEPYTRNQYIGIASDLSKVKMAPWDPEIWSKLSDALQKTGEGQGARKPANMAEFIDMAQAIQKEGKQNGWGELLAFVEKMLPESYLSFTARMEFLDKVLEKMNSDLVAKEGIYGKIDSHPAIYHKLKVDLDHMKTMKEFIIHQVTNIACFREERDSYMQILSTLKDNLITAIRNTDTRNNYDRFLRGLKVVGTSIVVGTATFITAKAQLMGIFSLFTQYPELVYVATVGAAVVGAFLMDATINWRKAIRINRLTKKYDKRMRRVMDEVKKHVRTYLQIVGFKATKEMAQTGYIEALQGEVSNAYFSAAFKGDFDTINRIYGSQVKDALRPPRAFARLVRFVRSRVSKEYGEQVYYDNKISLAAATSDGYAKPPANGNGGQP